MSMMDSFNETLQSELANKGQDAPVTYNSTQATNCAGCGKYKHTPLRVDGMGGYVCLTCIDERLEELLDAEQPSSGMAALYQEVTQLRDVVKAVANAFNGGPEHPWIPGYEAKNIYHKVMSAAASLPSGQSDDPSQ